MAMEYDAVSLPNTTYWVTTQGRSSTRNLSQDPDSPYVTRLPWGHERHDVWPHDEPKRFRDPVLRLAENILASEVGHPGMAHGDQHAGVAPVLMDQNTTSEMGSDGNSIISLRDIKGTRSFEELRPFPSHWLTNGYMKEADSDV
ncbi:hypothetical protein DHEL01_v213042 [Diaporthe helianthi]|uniref:Uncharacterized protein n=1 Tax=Diaporthe helianthi TaxID=158607 RepID=A0A2P5HE78_DIAHE|nr:hypothetical protein DHEL01_v213042 [Diaporthe helianthi]